MVPIGRDYDRFLEDAYYRHYCSCPYCGHEHHTEDFVTDANNHCERCPQYKPIGNTSMIKLRKHNSKKKKK